jgi:glycosyltransferase involved in cell wall biosynthesis
MNASDDTTISQKWRHSPQERNSDTLDSMRLLILTQVIDQNDPNLGFFLSWIKEFAKNVSHVEVVCLREGDHILPKNVRVHSLGKEHGGGRWSYVFRFYHTLWRLRGTYDAVFIHMNSEYLLLGGLFWKMMRKPTVLWHTHKSMTLIHRIGEKLVKIVATASPESYRLKSQKVRVLGHGIDTGEFAPGKRGADTTFRILSAGRVARAKGLDVILRATKSIVDEGTETELLIVGGPMTPDDVTHQEELKKLAENLGLEKVVHFVGPVPHAAVIPCLQKSDVFVNCSNTGSLDKAVLEAMAVGVPVVTSNDGLRTTLKGYEDALMFSHGDSEMLSKRLLHIKALGGDEREKLSSELRDVVVQSHGLSALIPKIVSLLE